ncbi:putative amylo-alpha-1,6-glucosidase domain protein [Mycobacterium xenopi 4042]|uniref:Putative amylo-alpha-1,6-glucosidase domain protein n=1 Tax=Mycobacterium xenopi 4042 TaxID=1299334 RepID=X8AG77_MYCXE|nr:putative amylo-alpha-1,6-glucosidase domain protein [Mycobacterium xenopi 4042]
MTLFGRDSLLTAWMALPLDVDLSLGTLRRLARAQGRREDPVTEEQPGRILHEVRRGPASEDVLGGSVYYGSIDATPLFVMLLGECWRWAPSRRSCGHCCRLPTRRWRGRSTMATATATASSNTVAPPTSG